MMVAPAYKPCIAWVTNLSRTDDIAMNSTENFRFTTFHQSLILEIFAAILFAQLAATLAIGAAIWWKNSQNTKTESQLIDTAHALVNQSIPQRPRYDLAAKQHSYSSCSKMRHHRVMVVDLGGAKDKDIAGRELKKNVLKKLRSNCKSNSEQEGKEASVRRLEIKGNTISCSFHLM